MIIQWYPGHMTKAIRMMEKEIKIMDVIVYVLDARAPFSCVNPKFTKLVNNKPFIYVLNKCDLADPEKTKEWYDYFSKKGQSCIMLTSTQSGSAKKLEKQLNVVLAEKMQKLQQKNIIMHIRAMILGVPNTGKSTLINNLSGKAKTNTGNKAGVTRGKQWVRTSSGIEVLDTPGTLWPAFDNNIVAKHLAYIGSIRDEVLDFGTLSLEFIKDVSKLYPNAIAERFNIEVDKTDTPLQILEKVCKARKFFVRGGEYDYDRGAYTILYDFKQGRMGNITLESVKDINAMLINDRLGEENGKK